MTGQELMKVFAGNMPEGWDDFETEIWEDLTEEEKEWYNLVAAKLQLKEDDAKSDK
jgi:hypothetical protein